MLRGIISFILTLSVVIMFNDTADAKSKSKRLTYKPVYSEQFDNDGRIHNRSEYKVAKKKEIIVAAKQNNVKTADLGSKRPSGCPSAWCGCWLSLEVFGKNIRELWLAKNWLKFRHTSPSVGSVAVMSRRGGGHVGIVTAFDEKGNPIIKSGNHGHRVGIGTYPKSRILAYVIPS
jgi:uncharacterized protein (TIGR02594 family)